MNALQTVSLFVKRLPPIVSAPSHTHIKSKRVGRTVCCSSGVEGYTTRPAGQDVDQGSPEVGPFLVRIRISRPTIQGPASIVSAPIKFRLWRRRLHHQPSAVITDPFLTHDQLFRIPGGRVGSHKGLFSRLCRCVFGFVQLMHTLNA